MRRNHIICIVGLPRTGKTTLQELIEEEFGYQRIITATTRKPQAGEEEDVDYHFVSQEYFLDSINDGSYFMPIIHKDTGIGYAVPVREIHEKDCCVICLEPTGVVDLLNQFQDDHVIDIIQLTAAHDVSRRHAEAAGDDLNLFEAKYSSELQNIEMMAMLNHPITYINNGVSDLEMFKRAARRCIGELIGSHCFDLRDVINDNIEVVFVDFDNTLCLHTFKAYDRDFIEKWKNAMIKRDVAWYVDNNRHYKSSAGMSEFLNFLFTVGVPVKVCTVHPDSTVLEPKKYFCEEHYEGLIDGYVIAHSTEHKINVILQYLRAFGIEPQNCLLVDDDAATLRQARANGVVALSSSYIIDSFK